MRHSVELLIVLVGCALVYRQLSPPVASPPAARPTPAPAAATTIDPIPPAPGVRLYECEHSFHGQKANELFRRALSEQGDRAEGLMEQATALEPGNASGFYHLAQQRGIKSNYEIRALTRAIQIQPGFAGAWNKRAWARSQTSSPAEWKSGLEDSRYALGLEAEPTYYDTRGYLLLRLGRIQEALPDVERAVREEPETSDHWEHRAAVYQALGRVKEAELDRARAKAL